MNPLRAIVTDDVRLYRDRDKWRARYYDAQGLRRFVRIDAPSEQAARTKLRRLQRAIDADPSLRSARAGWSIARWRDEWARTVNRSGSATTAAILASVALFAAHFGEGRDLATLDFLDGDQWVSKISARTSGKGGRISESTVRKHARHVKGWLEAAYRRELIPRNPLALVRSSQPQRDQLWPWIGPEEFALMLRGCADDCWRRLLALCRWGGLRRSEALALRWPDVDLVRGWLTVRNPRESITTKHRERHVRIRTELASLLEQHRKTTGLVCGLTTTCRVEEAVKVICRVAGFEPYARPLHTLRRCAGCEWIQVVKEDPFSVAKYLGHSPAVAQGWYFYPIDRLPRLAKRAPSVRGAGKQRGRPPRKLEDSAMPEEGVEPTRL